jgi:iron complex outermembrane receptor protein
LGNEHIAVASSLHRRKAWQRNLTASTIALAAVLAATSSGHAAPPAGDPVPSVAGDDAPPPPPPIPAASDETGIKTINIVGRHRAEDEQDVPIAITAVSGEQLQEQHIEQLVDFDRVVPNFNNINSNPRVSSNTFRGVGGNAANDGSESGVGLIIDNVFYTHVGFNFFNFTDLDHIELLAGPQGTLLGKNTAIAALDVTTNQPTFQPEATGELTTGSRSDVEFNGNVSGPILGDTLAGRLTVYDDYQQGYIRNHFNNELYGDTKREGVRGQFLYKPTDNFTDRLILTDYHSDEYNNYTSYLHTGPQFAANLLAKVPKGFDFTVFAGPNDFDVADQNRLLVDIEGVSNEANWNVNGVNLTSISAWEDFRFTPQNGGGNVPLQTSGFEVHTNANQFSQEFRAASTLWQDVDWQAGLYALRELIGAHARQLYGSDAAEFALGTVANPNPNVNAALLNGVESDHFGEANTTSVGPYLHAVWHITDQFDLAAGFRDTQEWKFDSDQATVKGTQNSPNLAETIFLIQSQSAIPGIAITGNGLRAVQNGKTFSFVPYTPNGPIAGSEQENSTSFTINPSYKITPNLLGYAQIAQSQISGAAVTNAAELANALGSVIPLFTKPETSTDYEIGLKSDWLDNHLRLNVNFYWDDVANFQTQVTDELGVLNGQNVTSSFLSNAPGVLLRGVEFEGQAVPFDDLTLGLNLAFNDARYTSFADAPNPFFNVAGARTAASPFASETGAQIPNAPRVAGNFNITYERPLTDRFTGFLFANESYRSRVYFVSSYVPQNYQTDFAVTDFGLGVRTNDDQYSLQFFVKNAFDTQYSVAITTAQGPQGSTTQTLAEPRFIGATFKVHFE